MMGTNSTLFFSSIGFRFEKASGSGSWHRFLNDRHFQETCLSRIPLGGKLKLVLCHSLLEYVPIMCCGVNLGLRWPRLSTTMYRRIKEICSQKKFSIVSIEAKSRWGTIPLKGGLWWASRFRSGLLILTCIFFLLLVHSYSVNRLMVGVLVQYQGEASKQSVVLNERHVKDNQRRQHARNAWGRVKFILDEDLVLERWSEDKFHCTMTVYIPHEKGPVLRRTKWFSETVSFSGLVLDSVTLLSSPDLDYLRYRIRYSYV